MEVSPSTRKARNEALFREVNERIREAADRLGGAEYEHAFLCECFDANCRDQVQLTLDEYERVRAAGNRFVVAPGHVAPEIEHVVAARADHVLVEKTGEAGVVAAELDPRAA
jgi:hypothetical protein